MFARPWRRGDLAGRLLWVGAMKTNGRKKLHLRAETLRHLDDDDLENARGRGTTGGYMCTMRLSGCTSTNDGDSNCCDATYYTKASCAYTQCGCGI